MHSTELYDEKEILLELEPLIHDGNYLFDMDKKGEIKEINTKIIY